MSIESFIIDGARSPIGTKNGQMVGVRSDDLAAQVIQGLMQRNANIPVETVEDVVVGCAFPEGPQGMLMARSISVLADLPIESGAKVVNRFCGSSMDSVHQLSQAWVDLIPVFARIYMKRNFILAWVIRQKFLPKI